MGAAPGAAIGAVYFLQEVDLVKLESRVNDFIEDQIAEGLHVLSVELTPIFAVGEYDYFATITVDLGADEQE